MRTFQKFDGRFSLLSLLCLIAFASGCSSGRYPVTGRVTYEDGSPLDAGIVIAEATVQGEPVSVQGNVEKDGTFSLGADLPGDGVLPGSYRGIVMPVALGELERSEGKLPAVSGKYTSYDTAGISFEVKPEDNVLNITVSKPKASNQ